MAEWQRCDQGPGNLGTQDHGKDVQFYSNCNRGSLESFKHLILLFKRSLWLILGEWRARVNAERLIKRL